MLVFKNVATLEMGYVWLKARDMYLWTLPSHGNIRMWVYTHFARKNCRVCDLIQKRSPQTLRVFVCENCSSPRQKRTEVPQRATRSTGWSVARWVQAGKHLMEGQLKQVALHLDYITCFAHSSSIFVYLIIPSQLAKCEWRIRKDMKRIMAYSKVPKIPAVKLPQYVTCHDS